VRIADPELERILVADHLETLRQARALPSLRLRLGGWLVRTGLRLAPELRPVT
jgi:hypothetical protein